VAWLRMGAVHLAQWAGQEPPKSESRSVLVAEAKAVATIAARYEDGITQTEMRVLHGAASSYDTRLPQDTHRQYELEDKIAAFTPPTQRSDSE
jgi:ABC-type Zn2+ transport system substrate-binding protein/surface adhesin